jgi:hypothetical protein
LPLEDALAHARLTAGDRVMATIGGRTFELCLHGGADGRWLCARDVHDRERAETSELAAARVRLLGRLSGSIVHDLNNLLGSAMGLASVLVPATEHAADRRLLDELQRGAQRCATMAGALARLLKVGPRQWQQVVVADLVAEAIGVARRVAVLQNVDLVPSIAVDLPLVHLVAAEATQVLLQGWMAVLARLPRRLLVTVTAHRQAIGGGRERDCVRVRCVAEGCQQRPADASAPASEWQLPAALVMGRAGGELTVAATADTATIDYVWPAATSA